jgi:hypothetical protein
MLSLPLAILGSPLFPQWFVPSSSLGASVDIKFYFGQDRQKAFRVLSEIKIKICQRVVVGLGGWCLRSGREIRSTLISGRVLKTRREAGSYLIRRR